MCFAITIGCINIDVLDVIDRPTVTPSVDLITIQVDVQRIFIIATAIVLFVAFCMGWFTNWLVHRFVRVKASDVGELERLAQELHEAEETRDQAITYLQQREAELTNQLSQTEAELRAAMDGLGEARREGSLVLVRRALVLLALGYTFLVLAWEEDILHFYGYYFLLAIPCLWLSARGLLVVAALALLAGLAAFAGPVSAYLNAASGQLFDSSGYVEAVLGQDAEG